MMNELLELSRQLKEAGIPVPLQHVDVGKTMAGKKLVVLIGRDGCPVHYYLSNRGVFYCHSKRNHHFFPVIRVHKSLCAPENVPKDSDTSLNQPFVLNPESKDIMLSTWTQNQLMNLCLESRALHNLGTLIGRFPDTEEKTQRFNRNLVNLIQKDIAYRPELQAMVRNIFFGRNFTNSDQKPGKSDTQIAFDIVDADPDAFPIQHPELWNTLIRLLRERDRIEAENKTIVRGISYLSGQEMILERDKTPDPTLPILGSAFVYSRDDKVKYFTRYGLNGLDFHIGKRELDDAVDALMFLVQERLKGRTWRAFPGKKKVPDLLIAYVEQRPQDGLADLFGGSDEFYNEVVARLVEQFQDRSETDKDRIPPRMPKYTIRLLVLNKIDDARKQVLLNRQYERKGQCGRNLAGSWSWTRITMAL